MGGQRLSPEIFARGGSRKSIVALRIFLFSMLPIIVAAVHMALDKSAQSRERSLDVFLLYLFGVGVAGSCIGGFFGHFFLSDLVAESIGWPKGNPFQLEVGFANLAIGILGALAMGRRDGFREATVIAVTVLGVGRPSSTAWTSSRPVIWRRATRCRT